jgi:hypothetical protein
MALSKILPASQAQYVGARNLIINGNMAVAQRGVSFTSPSAGAYTLDRFKYNENFGAACTITQSTDVPSSNGFLNSMKIDITTAATPANAEEFKIDYGVEGQDFSRAGFGTSGAQALTLSFWVKSNVTGVYRVNFLNKNGTGNKIVGGTYTINIASTWENKTIAIPADTAQATYLTNVEGFRIEFYLASGPDRTSGSLPTDWIAYDATRRAAGQAVNLASNTSNEWYITGVQLEVGSATPFEHESYGDTLLKCQRYFELCGLISRTDNLLDAVDYKVEKRAQSTIAVVSSDASGFSVSVNEHRDSRQGFYQSANASHTTRVTMSSDAEL